jgi:CheY-like chemotaxis protein/HPt (histidine-containing phosphotransfer) domain-containing protein
VEYNAASAINDTVNLNMIHIGKKPIQFNLSVDERIPSIIYGDELRIRQMLNNLLSNAFKYTKEGTVSLSITVENPTAPAAGEMVWFIFVIRDSGIGIRKEDIDRLFTAYSQVDVRNNRAIQGTGLGLSICKNLSTLMGGNISVESEYGKGSAFTLRIPQKTINPQPIGPAAARSLEKFEFNNIAIRERSGHPRFQLPYARVLVVDDVSINLDVASGMLLPYGLTVDCVESGAEAVRLVREHREHYDAIFMDHMMPGMDGLEAVRIIRSEIDSEYARTVPVIALTANALVGNDKIFLEKGFQDFLTKPIDSIKLDAALDKWVRNRELEKQNQPDPGEPDAEPRAAEPAAAESAAAKPGAIPGVDFAAGVARMGNREEAYLRVLASYASKLPALLDKLRQPEAGTLGDYAITIHGIKGASYGICADETGKAAAALEAAAKQGDLASVQADTGSFILAAEQLTAAIMRLLNLPKKI